MVDKVLDDADIVVEHDDDPPAGGEATGAAAKPKTVVSPEEGIDDLRSQLSSERASREAAERRASAAETSAVQAVGRAQDSDLHLVTNAIETVKLSQSTLKQRYAEAMAAGDFEGAADIQMTMATSAAQLQKLEEGKAALEAQPKPQVRAAADPVEALASQLTPRSASWVRSHPEFARDPNQYQRMLAAHNLAMAEGVEPDSDEYFAAVEGTLKIGSRPAPRVEADDPTTGAARVTQTRQSAPPEAPVTRSTGPTGQRQTTVRLTAAEREIAANNGMTEQEYAKNKLALQREGRMH